MISAVEVKKYGAKIGLDIVGVTSAESFPEYVEIVRNRIKNGLILLNRNRLKTSSKD